MKQLSRRSLLRGAGVALGLPWLEAMAPRAAAAAGNNPVRMAVLYMANGVNTSIRCDIDGVTSFVPIDPANTDYAAIMSLVAEGKLTIAPASP